MSGLRNIVSPRYQQMLHTMVEQIRNGILQPQPNGPVRALLAPRALPNPLLPQQLDEQAGAAIAGMRPETRAKLNATAANRRNAIEDKLLRFWAIAGFVAELQQPALGTSERAAAGEVVAALEWLVSRYFAFSLAMPELYRTSPGKPTPEDWEKAAATYVEAITGYRARDNSGTGSSTTHDILLHLYRRASVPRPAHPLPYLERAVCPPHRLHRPHHVVTLDAALKKWRTAEHERGQDDGYRRREPQRSRPVCLVDGDDWLHLPEYLSLEQALSAPPLPVQAADAAAFGQLTGLLHQTIDNANRLYAEIAALGLNPATWWTREGVNFFKSVKKWRKAAHAIAAASGRGLTWHQDRAALEQAWTEHKINNHKSLAEFQSTALWAALLHVPDAVWDAQTGQWPQPEPSPDEEVDTVGGDIDPQIVVTLQLDGMQAAGKINAIDRQVLEAYINNRGKVPEELRRNQKVKDRIEEEVFSNFNEYLHDLMARAKGFSLKHRGT